MFEKLTTDEAGLLLHSLRSVWVADMAQTHQKLARALERRLADEGLVLRDPGFKPASIQRVVA